MTSKPTEQEGVLDPEFERHEIERLEGRVSKHGNEWGSLDEVQVKSIRWVEKPLLQHAAFHLLTGRKGVGKGTYLANVAARVTRGEFGDKRTVLWVGSEDSAAIDVKPRLMAAGGDPANVKVDRRGYLELPRDYAWLRNSVESFGNVGMLVIDPVSNHIAGLNSDNEGDVRTAIAQLNRLADEFDCMVFGVRHLTEKLAANGIISAILGSSAWVQTPRAVLAAVRDDEDLVHVQAVANNRLKPEEAKGFIYRIVGVQLDGLDEEVTHVERVGESSADLDALLSSSGRDQTASARARELILELLAAESPRTSADLDAEVLDMLAEEELELREQALKNLRVRMAKRGQIRQYPERDEHGAIKRHMVARGDKGIIAVNLSKQQRGKKRAEDAE